jgi:hypothetical protein
MIRDNYAERQREHNAAYTQAYAEWVAKLSPKQQRKLRQLGVLEAQVDSFETGNPIDITELPIAYTGAEMVTEDENENPNPSEEEAEKIWAALRRLIAELLADHNPALALDCLALVSGVGFMGDSMTAIARRHRVTRAAVSKRCIQLTRQLDLLPSRAMKSLTARSSYRTAQCKNYGHREHFDNGRHPRPGN